MIQKTLEDIQANYDEMLNKLDSIHQILVDIVGDTPRSEKSANDFIGCQYCIHASDTDEICILRRCKHAIHSLNECYHKR